MTKSLSFFVVGALAGALLAAAVFAATTRPGGRSAASRTLRVAHSLPTTHPVHAGMEFMAKRVGELSSGRLALVIYPSEQLGNETQTLEQVQAGTIDMTKASAAALGNFVLRMNVFSLPYLFRDEAHYWKVLDGPIGRELLDGLASNDRGEPSGFIGLCYYDAGSRNFYAKAAIAAPGDVAGRKLRVMNDPIAMDMVQALGGSAAPIAMGELYTALKQGVVDGAENNPPTFVSMRHYEVCGHFTFDHHSRIPDVLLMSEIVWQSLSPQEQGWLREAARESSLHQRARWSEAVGEAVEKMKSEGVSIHEADLEAFRAATAPVRASHATGPLGELVRRIETE